MYRLIDNSGCSVAQDDTIANAVKALADGRCSQIAGERGGFCVLDNNSVAVAVNVTKPEAHAVASALGRGYSVDEAF